MQLQAYDWRCKTVNLLSGFKVSFNAFTGQQGDKFPTKRGAGIQPTGKQGKPRSSGKGY